MSQALSEKAVSLLVGALKIYSPTKREGKLAAFLSRQMKDEFGYKVVETDTAGNVVGEVGDGPKRVLLCGHMDTVPGRLAVRVGGGKIYGRGAVDAKSPLCAMVVAGSRLGEQTGARVTVACVTREEGDSLGIRTIIKSKRRFDYAIFGEPSGANRVTVGYRGRVGVHIGAYTEGGHAGSPWAHLSAIDAGMRLLRRLKQYEKQHTRENDHARSLSTCLTVINGGTYHNVLPSVAKLTVDVRIPPGMTSDQVEKDIRRVVEESRTKSARFEVGFDDPTEPYEADLSSRLVRAFQRAIILKTGQRPIMVRKTGTGDMNTLASATGTSCVTYGPGEANLSHTSNEFVSVEDYTNSIEVLGESVKQLSILERSV